MIHLRKNKKISRKSSHRISLLQNLSLSLLKYKSIKTTIIKAKFLQPFIEKIITSHKNKKDYRGFLSSKIYNNSFLHKEIKKLALLYNTKNGGYTRILKYSYKYGDCSPMAIIKFI